MNSFEAYQLYTALKLHFTTDSYDFFKYGGKTRASLCAFEKSNQKYQYEKLSKKLNPKNYLIANFLERNIKWPGDLFDEEGEKIYLDFEKRNQSLFYIFKNEIEQFQLSSIKIKDGQHPRLLQLYKSKKLSIENLIILDDIFNFFSYWNRRINDTIFWPDIHFKCEKYRPFFTYDKDKYKKVLLDFLSERM
jgi:hypothetical protein